MAVLPWASETVLPPWLAIDEDRVSHVLSHVVWWKIYTHTHIYINQAALSVCFFVRMYIVRTYFSDEIRILISVPPAPPKKKKEIRRKAYILPTQTYPLLLPSKLNFVSGLTIEMLLWKRYLSQQKVIYWPVEQDNTKKDEIFSQHFKLNSWNKLYLWKNSKFIWNMNDSLEDSHETDMRWWEYIYIYIYIYTQLFGTSRMQHSVNFKRSLSGLTSEFSFSETDCYIYIYICIIFWRRSRLPSK